MDDEELREILSRVAAGELDADEAVRLLDPEAADAADVEDDTDAGADDDFDEPVPPRTEPPPGDRATELRVSGVTRKLLIVGDPSVREILVRGAPIRRENGTLIVDGEPDEWLAEPFARGFATMHAGPWAWESGRHRDRRRERSERFERFERFEGPGRRGYAFRPIEIRAHPDLALNLDLTAGNARVSGMHGPIACSTTAGSAVFTDARGPFDCTVAAGSLAIDGWITEGDSRINCDMGSVKLRLAPASDVRITVDATLGKADVRFAGWGGPGEQGEWVLGNGTASLAITASMSSVKVRSQQ
jgi:hypothetical protein